MGDRELGNTVVLLVRRCRRPSIVVVDRVQTHFSWKAHFSLSLSLSCSLPGDLSCLCQYPIAFGRGGKWPRMVMQGPSKLMYPIDPTITEFRAKRRNLSLVASLVKQCLLFLHEHSVYIVQCQPLLSLLFSAISVGDVYSYRSDLSDFGCLLSTNGFSP